MSWKWWHTHDWTEWEDSGNIERDGLVIGFRQIRTCKTCGLKEKNDVR